METHLIDGKKVAFDLIDSLKKKYHFIKKRPKLAVILVGSNPASQIYVQKKCETAASCGIESQKILLSETVLQEDLESTIFNLNKDESVHGILVQLPLPQHIDANRIIQIIDPKKDVDGFHPYNMGKILCGTESFENDLIPCTPKGCILLLNTVLSAKDMEGLDALVIGASNIVGKPLASLLVSQKCTVQIAHSKTQHLKQKTKIADIIICATGVQKIITPDDVKSGVIILDVGINKDVNGKIVGDCLYRDFIGIARAITPVPGGVGPMTVACLMQNTFIAYNNLLK